MASVSVYETLVEFLRREFEGLYPVLHVDDVEPVLQQGQEAFLVLEEISAEEALAGFGDQSALCTRETGTMLVHCFTPAPESSSAARFLADRVRDKLRYATFTTGLRILQTLPPDLESMNDGLWTVGGFTISYDYDEHYARPGTIEV